MMTKGRIINLVLKENFKRIELRIPCECELFMIDHGLVRLEKESGIGPGGRWGMKGRVAVRTK